jgi:uncharacterized protein
MLLNQFIRQVIASTPEHRVVGKKRLQKLVFLLSDFGYEIDAKFFLKDYGPFSREVEYEADMMTIFGEVVEKDVSVGYSNYKATEYSLSDDPKADIDNAMSFYLKFFEEFRTVELEVASTIHYFIIEGRSREVAVELTKTMKPSKTTDRVLESASKILNYLVENNESSKNSRSYS